jgi:tRNA(Leu) C34 or U34 (ribose-2'-O)-methylase TrmL
VNEIAIVNPKYVQNLASIVRAAACLGANKVWYSGSRIKFEDRIPREMRLYREIELINNDYFITKSGLTPVAVELLPGAQDIRNFRHPENPTLYVFGPEDGSIPKSIRRLCHSFIQIPTKHCVSLPAAVHLTLYDRMIKQ